MKLFYTDHFVLPLPDSHRFPMRKYALLRRRIMDSELNEHCALCVPPAARDDQLRRVHTVDYISRVKHGELSTGEVRSLGFPWSPELVERSRRSTGATIEAARSALVDGCGINLAGGTHHAFSDHGGGFCVFNDGAVAARVMQFEQSVVRVMIIDCDVHQGDGTAAIFAQDDSVFTLSIHGANNYPLRKQRSDLDVPLADGTTDEIYLEKLSTALTKAFERACPELAIYVSGADPYLGDRYGRLALTMEGLASRDRMVFDACRIRGVPVSVTMSGGYANNIEEIVSIHFQTIMAAAEAYLAKRSSPGP